MYESFLKCRQLKAGMRVTREVVCGDFLLAEEGAVLTEPLIHLFSFLGVRRVAVDTQLTKRDSASSATLSG